MGNLLISAVVMIAGALVYAIAKNETARKLAIIAYAAGILVTLLVLQGKAIHLP